MMNTSPSTSPIVPDSTFTEREGIHHVGLVASQMGFVWRETPNTDLGIDGYLEVTVNGAPIGLIAVQVKSGLSYMGTPKDSTAFTFRAERKHVRYWLSYRLPVIVIVYDPVDNVAYWHYIQDYFQKQNQEPTGAGKVPIRILKSSVFNRDAKDRLTEIAASPDSTAHAMLALRASRYKHTNELLTRREMLEFYTKRRWLGDWLPLDKTRERILLHSTLAKRGPGWFWFRPESKREYLTHLRDALQHRDTLLRREAGVALAAVAQQDAVNDLKKILDSNLLDATEALASISNLALHDKRNILDLCFALLQKEENENVSAKQLLSSLAKISGSDLRDQIRNYYLQSSHSNISLLRGAGYLWSKDEVPALRLRFQQATPIEQSLIISALIEIGEYQDIDLILKYMSQLIWIDDSRLRSWSKQLARLFGVEDIKRLRQMLQADRTQQVLAHQILSDLCYKFDEQTLIQMLNDPMPEFRRYAAKGLAEAGSSYILDNYREYVGDSTAHELSCEIARGTAMVGKWVVVEKYLDSPDEYIRTAVADGLRFVPEMHKQRAYEHLFNLVQDNDLHVQIAAGGSLALIGNENILQKIVEWLPDHYSEQSLNIMASVLIYLDRRFYCPFEQPIDKFEMKRDFSIFRYSETRDDYR